MSLFCSSRIRVMCGVFLVLWASLLFACVAHGAGAPSVASFGAVGDGETDDTAAIQAAVSSGVLRFGRGAYRITAPIVMQLSEDGYRSVVGEAGATQLIMAGPGPALHFVGTHGGTANPSSVRPEVWQRERLPIVRDLEIVGVHEEADGIRLERTMQCSITRVLVRNCRHGIHLVDRNRNLTVSDSHLYENRATGIFFDNVNLHQVNIIGNHISYGGEAGILVLNGEVRNIQITGNDIEYNYQRGEPGAADISFDTREGTLREFTITGNTIQAVPSEDGANIRIYGAPSDQADLSGLGAITGNLIGSQTVNIDLQHTRGVTVSGNSIYSGAELSLRARHCRNLAIAGNTVDYNPGSEDRMRDGFLIENCEDVSIAGNTLADCRAGDAEQGGAISILNSSSVLVGNNIITDPAVRGIDVRNSAFCRIADNIIRDARDPATMTAAIAVDDRSTTVTVRDNLITEERSEP